MVQLKELDIEKVFSFAFSWLRDARLQKLIGAFYLSNLILSIAIVLMFGILGSMVLLFIPQDIVESLIQYVQQATGERLIDLSYLAMLGFSFVLLYLVITISGTVFVYYYFGWNRDFDFNTLVKKILKALFYIYAVPVIIVSAAIITLILVFTTQLTQTGDLIFSILLPVGFLLFVLAGITYTIVNIFGFRYIHDFFLTAKVLEIGGQKTLFADITLANFVACVKLYIVELFATIFNFVSPTMMKIQGTLIGLSIVLILLGLFVSSYLYVFLLPTALAYFVTIIYNMLRFSFSSVVRILEVDGAVAAVRQTWEYTRKYAFAIALVAVVTAIASMILSLLLSVPASVVDFLASLIPALVILKSISSGISTLTDTLATVLVAMIYVLMRIAIYVQVLAALGKKPLNF